MTGQQMKKTSHKEETGAWHWPAGLISLRVVETYCAKRLAVLSGRLASAWHEVLDFPEVTEKQKVTFLAIMAKIAEEADLLFLPMTAIHARRMISDFDKVKTDEDMQASYGELENRFSDEIGSINFFLVKPERFKFYENTELAGEQFKSNFPKGNAELIEAGNCIVTDRYTACVFHLMRALEIALISLERKLDIPRPQEGPNKTWGRTLGRIKDKISEYDKLSPQNWPNDREFCDKAHAFLAAVKTPLRDDTMHVETTYDEQSAFSVFRVSVEALRFLATKLSEKS